MDRLKAIVERVENELKSQGYKKNPIFDKSETGYGDPSSFFDLLVDLQLDGKKDITLEELWENMKKQINEKDSLIEHAEKEYRKLQNNYRNLQNDYQELLKSKG